MAKSNNRKLFRQFLILFWGSVVIWMFIQMQASGFDKSILETNSSVTVENTSDYILFSPTLLNGKTTSASHVAILFYPGALVQAEAYAPYARELAERGITTIIQKIPFRLALTKSVEQKVFRRTLSLFSEYPDSTKWILAGHSKGGAMASGFARIYPDKLSGLFLIGTSHPRRIDLSNLSIPVTKIYGSEDGLASPEEVKEFSRNLPKQTRFVLVQGGNHSQFGYYGTQLGSGTATISQEEQQKQLLQASLEMLLNLN